ncbi:putative RNA recognition motif domain, nucleotide-binding alpha-beta plait domain superfamily [Helianthus annuus]|nr:putative RNA recognition motif domain, nucleotide-binding alpha-beta plait domain superfamily [Helianthus annuus]KAJ0632675.1 putative RNA recognition motif domain, nucleotide-binding alpha-beta plait domain superfamily [Helianthus annuus]KAJ0826591.1 putative RNA recognition motif domain, nucleotide-binding alpha-beta plait domain superfamily [Helianthus annuus]KAJ0954128.1 putative RNA recognition motif domain, nucleotide-binding alpha-beta plait domain superfamily [Helianthus annuus]
MGDCGQNVVKFFVTNLPDKCSSKEIGDVFSEYGVVEGVYVARKRDKVGNRFGFVTFSGVRNKKDLVDSLKVVRMGNNKLKIKVAKFALENNSGTRPTEHAFRPGHVGGKDFIDDGYPHINRHVGYNPLGTSYRDTLLGKSVAGRKNDKVVEVSSYVKPFESGQSLIVRTVDLSTLVTLDKLLDKWEGYKISLKYVGGLYMLLCFVNMDEMLAFKDNSPFVKDWFSWVEVWNGQALPFERLAWLKVTGVPLHLLDNEVFDSVGRLFGKVVHSSTLNSKLGFE